MSYRSLKRVLGERNLERKCLVLFSGALFLLLGVGFWWVDRIAENLVVNTTNSKARDLFDLVLYEEHWEHYTTDIKDKPLRKKLVDELLRARFSKRFLSDEVPQSYRDWQTKIWPAENADEQSILSELKHEQNAQREARRSQAVVVAPAEKADPLDVVAQPKEEAQPPFATRVSRERNKYNYYQPVEWRESCILCHENFYGRYAESAAEATRLGSEVLPFMVVKVTLPYKETGDAINATRAVLATVAILTVVVAIVALWVIVRYVVVKPLNHLRDVSDAVSRGHIEQRAEIRTGDEFEYLATSFNKMLRHLVDTQAEIRNMNKDLDAKVDELAQLNMRLYEMNRLKSDFLATMTHELRTPLNSIIGFSEVLGGIESLTDKQRRYVQNIQKSGRDLLALINEVLDLSKLEAGQMELRLSEFQIDRIVSSQCDMVRSLTEEKNIDLVVNVDSDLPPLYQDQVKIQRIITNLLSNAIKFTPDGGRVEVAAHGTPQGMVVIEVTDTGVGIAESDREIIFEKFRQGSMVLGRDSLTREFSGTGLGLSIVKELCKRLGGEVTVHSELGKGSTFTVSLPWLLMDGAKQSTPLQAKLDELGRPQRLEFGTSELPVA